MPHFSPPRATVYANAAVLTFPYEPDLIAALKREIPAYSRSYDPDTRAWTIRVPHDDRAIRLLREFFPHAEVSTADAHQHHTPPPRRPAPLAAARHYAVLCITPDAPAEIVAAVYRAWCKLTHPDALPAGERDRAHARMVAINAAFEALRSELSEGRA